MSQTVTDRASRNVFLSYSSNDTEFAAHLTSILRDRGISILGTGAGIKIGDDIAKGISEALKISDTLIFVVPSREGEGRNALAELGAAKALGKRIVAVMPNSSRAWNSDFARQISDASIVDASRMDDNALLDALAMAS